MTDKIATDYYICEGASRVFLIDNVNSLMDDNGWEPVGGVAIDGSEGYADRFFQAMVKKEIDSL